MAEGDEPPKDLARMSLDSLKREMEVQKSKTEMAREESRDRQRREERRTRAFPWGMVLGIVLLGAGGLFGIVFLLRASMPRFAESVLPAFMYVPPPDAGPRPVDAWIEPDAGDDAYVVHAHHPHPPPSSGAAQDDLNLGDLGDGRDPIGGVGP